MKEEAKNIITEMWICDHNSEEIQNELYDNNHIHTLVEINEEVEKLNQTLEKFLELHVND